jgi:hypothetical protein
MATRPRDSLDEARQHVAAARRMVNRMGLRQTHPDNYIPRGREQDEWDRLLGQLK